MARPHPVIGIAAEFSNGTWWCGHQPDVAVLLVNEEVVAVSRIESFDLGFDALSLLFDLLYELFGRLFDHRFPLLLVHRRLEVLEYQSCNVFHPLEETDGQSWIGQFLGPGHRPESVLEIVVLDAAVPLDKAVAAVVVGQDKPFGRNHLCCAAASEQQNRILERSPVDAVDVLGVQPESLALHIANPFCDK